MAAGRLRQRLAPFRRACRGVAAERHAEGPVEPHFAAGPIAGTRKTAFRVLGAAATRMATRTSGRRIAVDDVEAEADRLKAQWRRGTTASTRPRGEGPARLLGSRAEGVGPHVSRRATS